MKRLRRRTSVTDDDGEIIAASVGDPEQFAAIFDRHAPTIHRYLARRSGPQQADDLVGETFLAAFRRRGSYDTGYPDALPWLYGIATNVLAQHRRDNVRILRTELVAPRDAAVHCHADQVAADVTAAALRGALIAAVDRLSDGDRDVLLLVVQEQLTYEQVAAALDVPVGTVRSRLHRARATLRAALGGTNPTTSYEEVVSNG
jgi:RNA polymerase sigma-70 factor (ECF subfamily)